MEELTPSIEGSKLEVRGSQLKRVTKARLNGRGVKRPFNLSLDDDDDDEDDETAPSASPLPTAPPVQAAEFDDSQSSLAAPRLKPGRGRPPKLRKAENHVKDIVESTAEQIGAMGEEFPIQIEDEVGELEQAVEEEVAQEAGADEDDAQAGEDGEEQEQAQEPEEAQTLKKPRRGRTAANSRKDQNAKMKPPPPPKGTSVQKQSKTAPNQFNKSSSRSVYVSRSETPAQDSGARTTRAGRNVLKPVAFWRGERIVYGDGLLEGSVLTLPGIKEVIRTEEVAAPKPKRPVYRRSKSKSRVRGAQGKEEEEEEEEDEREPWETEAGIVRAQVLQWDSITGRYDEENTEEAGMSSMHACAATHSPFLADFALTGSLDVAYAAEAIEMRDIGGSDFRFAKTLTLPFFGSGMVDLPPGGAKRVKNSRKMQLIFFVYYGRVTVEVGTPTTVFSIGKGGMWQVPRGMFFLHFFKI